MQKFGIIFQSEMPVDKHTSAVVRTCLLQLCEFRNLRNFILKLAVTLTNVLIFYRIDYCNILFYGLPKYSLHRLKKYKTPLLIT